MQIYFHSRLCSYLSRVPILMEGTVLLRIKMNDLVFLVHLTCKWGQFLASVLQKSQSVSVGGACWDAPLSGRGSLGRHSVVDLHPRSCSWVECWAVAHLLAVLEVWMCPEGEGPCLSSFQRGNEESVTNPAMERWKTCIKWIATIDTNFLKKYSCYYWLASRLLMLISVS